MDNLIEANRILVYSIENGFPENVTRQIISETGISQDLLDNIMSNFYLKYQRPTSQNGLQPT